MRKSVLTFVSYPEYLRIKYSLGKRGQSNLNDCFLIQTCQSVTSDFVELIGCFCNSLSSNFGYKHAKNTLKVNFTKATNVFHDVVQPHEAPNFRIFRFAWGNLRIVQAGQFNRIFWRYFKSKLSKIWISDLEISWQADRENVSNF